MMVDSALNIDPETSLLLVTEEDILPTCEFNVSTNKRHRFFFWRKVDGVDHCTQPARWILVIRLDQCIDHDHDVMVCDEHKDFFDHIRIVHFTCSSLTRPSVDYRVLRVDRI